MLEEITMDKKSMKCVTPQSRASAVDCKKDLTHKPSSRYNKKREVSSNTSKNEPYRKNNAAQRGRSQLDRRPRQRGYGGFAVGGMENSWVAEEEPDYGSIYVPGSKKQNLNHLLNFSYPARGVSDRKGPVYARSNPHQKLTHPHNQELFLQACCQFVVREDGDYKVNLMDPDVPIKWEQIEEILVRSTGKSECPICLGNPVAGRVGRCGHVYCWPCALHYAETHDKQPPPCPVCLAPFKVDLMKPARIVQWEAPTEEISMRLVRRLRGSTVVELAPPRGQITEFTSQHILPVTHVNDAPYTKLFSASKEQIRDILLREKEELQNQILVEIDTSELVYIERALSILKEKETSVANRIGPLKVDKTKNDDEVPIVYEKHDMNKNKVDWFDEDEGASCMKDLQEQISVMSIHTSSNLNPDAAEFDFIPNDEPTLEPALEDEPSSSTSNNDNSCELYDNNLTEIDKENQSKYFYFYQADDGQQVFLNSLNVRILNDTWGALVAAPSVIRGKILHRETFSLADPMRKHMPYAAHLPLYCPVEIVEIDLQPPYVSSEALKNFSAELERRARVRAKNERDERRRERAYRRKIEGPPKPDLSSELVFPPTIPLSVPIFNEVVEPPEVSPNAEVVAASPSRVSFANMASASGTWRVRPNQAKEGPPSPPPPVDEEGNLVAPRGLNLCDAIEAALHAAPAAVTTKGGKKKKNKQKPLFVIG